MITCNLSFSIWNMASVWSNASFNFSIKVGTCAFVNSATRFTWLSFISVAFSIIEKRFSISRSERFSCKSNEELHFAIEKKWRKPMQYWENVYLEFPEHKFELAVYEVPVVEKAPPKLTTIRKYIIIRCLNHLQYLRSLKISGIIWQPHVTWHTRSKSHKCDHNRIVELKFKSILCKLRNALFHVLLFFVTIEL